MRSNVIPRLSGLRRRRYGGGPLSLPAFGSAVVQGSHPGGEHPILLLRSSAFDLADLQVEREHRDADDYKREHEPPPPEADFVKGLNSRLMSFLGYRQAGPHHGLEIRHRGGVHDDPGMDQLVASLLHVELGPADFHAGADGTREQLLRPAYASGQLVDRPA